jgi:hypothetical protein
MSTTEYVQPTALLREMAVFRDTGANDVIKRRRKIAEAFALWFAKHFLSRFPLPVVEVRKELVKFDAKYALTQEEFEFLRYVLWCLGGYRKDEGVWMHMYHSRFTVIQTEKDKSSNWGHGAIEIHIKIPNTLTNHGGRTRAYDADGNFKGNLTVEGLIINPLGEKLLSERFGCTLNGPEEAAQTARKMEIQMSEDSVKRSEEYIKNLEAKVARLKETNRKMWDWK